MQNNSLLLISQEPSLAKVWQTHFLNVQIEQSHPNELAETLPAVVVLDCSTLAYKDCDALLARLQSRRVFALVLEIQLADYGALFLRDHVTLLSTPLNNFGIQQIQQALQTSETIPVDDSRPITYSDITREFARYAQDPTKLLQTMADAVRVTMNADWVAFVRVDLHDDAPHSVESLAVSE